MELEFRGARLRGRRLERGYSQRRLAREAGVSAAYISLIEQDRRTPDPAVVERLKRALSDASAAHGGGERVAAASTNGARSPNGSADIGHLLETSGLDARQRSLIEALAHAYVAGLIARVREGRPLVTDLSAPWQTRVLETLQEKMTEDFEQFRDAYVNRLDEL